ncbi:MAG: hypothetical protein ABFS30_09650, partial [Pseudomonadota bacterium]
GLAIKLISNYTNSIAGTPLDPEAEELRWEKPVIRERRPAALPRRAGELQRHPYPEQPGQIRL